MPSLKDCNCGSVLTALFTRIVFTLHVLVALWRILVMIPWSHWYWFLLVGLFGLVIETIVTIYVRKGAEYKWLCPSVLLYLLSIVPCVWILELAMLDERIETSLNQTQEAHANPNYNFTLLTGFQPQIPEMEDSQWVVMIEQMLLFVLILGRWMLPKGDISRDELSQLLLVYIGMAADIIEFFEAFKEERVRTNKDLILTILGIWSASLLQFCLVLTATKSKKGRAGFQAKEEEDEESACCEACSCCGTEVFGIMTTVILQDGPFLTLRLLLLVSYSVKSYMHIFFTVKNSLVLLLMFYRLYVVFENKRHANRKSSVQSDTITASG